ncbi:TIGR04283 family arsenosugar biosynthesis glycosyltransferase [Oscillatoria sp. FACHB-1406]|uniref:TIGR04283 family arsenosugar biosynthesis glycosyltransferase n=1 Tax=Oscillatoria sp. FACHB-1406 TaxID=2692846 RepID=UPI0016895D37|nr:TIGR04283 family arsenosugar biosynthesis glycosyltransferase [Oscillatoria sp. FACHB-1406]MBD2577453.1 TIGR04283 family arsenosugar biosynthesis glycosyltransferase [Oscillatoria sp. FACHB-1406]
MKKVSIIIPTFNEAENIAKTLQCAQTGTDIEIIVVDGGSEDKTIEIVRQMSANVIASPQLGRAAQMNYGAEKATGEILLFLHGDTRLPLGYDAEIRTILGKSGVVAGAFELKIDAPLRSLRWVERMVRVRSRFLQLPYGDQGIFLKTSTFKELSGFPILPIMEDFEFVRRLKRRGKIAIASLPVTTSARRWLKLGVVKTTALNQLIILAYFLGIPPDRLRSWYRGLSKSA